MCLGAATPFRALVVNPMIALVLALASAIGSEQIRRMRRIARLIENRAKAIGIRGALAIPHNSLATFLICVVDDVPSLPGEGTTLCEAKKMAGGCERAKKPA